MGVFKALGMEVTMDEIDAFLRSEAEFQSTVTGRPCEAWRMAWPLESLRMRGLSHSQDEEVDALRRQLREQSQAIRVYEESRSWKLTAPLRRLGQVLRNLRSAGR